MKRIYENFTEMARDFVDGECWTHWGDGHPVEECIGWQRGAQSFAAWLDRCGLEILQKPDIYENLWDAFRAGQQEVL